MSKEKDDEKTNQLTPNRLDEIIISLRKASYFDGCCDFCDSQEGRHHCLLYSVSIKNMDTVICDDFKWKKI